MGSRSYRGSAALGVTGHDGRFRATWGSFLAKIGKIRHFDFSNFKYTISSWSLWVWRTKKPIFGKFEMQQATTDKETPLFWSKNDEIRHFSMFQTSSTEIPGEKICSPGPTTPRKPLSRVLIRQMRNPHVSTDRQTNKQTDKKTKFLAPQGFFRVESIEVLRFAPHFKK